MTVDELVAYYPRLYHMASGGSWPTIQAHGLLTTAQIVSTSDLPEPEQARLLRQRRPVSTELTHPVLGRVTIRDQVPLREHILAAALTDLTQGEWLDLLNGRVFFWLHQDRLRALRAARLFRNKPHDVITVDTRSLVAAYHDRIQLSPINSGSTLYPNAPRRGSDTFRSIEDYPFAERRKGRSVAAAVTELTVVGGVPDLTRHVRGVDHYPESSV